MKLLILGASSQLGRELTALLKTQKVPFEALATEDINLLKQMDVVKAVTRINPTQIINVASYSNLEKAETDKEAARLCDIVNSQGVSTLAEVCDHLNLPLVHHSSSYVFDGLKTHPYTEEDETNPVCRYGQSKWYGERAIRDALANHVILRTDWLFSTWRSKFFKLHIDACRANNGKIDVRNHRFSPTPASDVARVILAIVKQLDCDAEAWGTYHYSALQPMSQEHFVEFFLHEAAKLDASLSASVDNLDMNILPVELPYIPNTVLSSEKIMETFGIKQRSRGEELLRVLGEVVTGVKSPELSEQVPKIEVPAPAGKHKARATTRTANKPAVRKTPKKTAKAPLKKISAGKAAEKDK